MFSEEKETKQQETENNTVQGEQEEASEEVAKPEKELAEEKINELNDKYLRLYSEFDNFKKRTIKERAELIKTAAADVYKSLLPVIDDFERGLKSINETQDQNSLKEGVNLIYTKLKNTLSQKGLEEMDALNKEFNADLHEAITSVPVEKEEMKGKIVEVVEKGYYLNGKVIRFAKVVIGS
jgi:molecular chaperone GrpE